jgi:hypothetical protein
MIQRIQSIFLAICAVIFILFTFMPLKQVVKEGITKDLTAVSGFNKNFPYSVSFDTMVAFCFIGIAAAIIAILCYKQRYLQIRFCYILIGIGVLGLILLNATDATVGFSRFESVPMLTNILFALVIICALSASVFIKKDINLLKKADRIR